LFRSTMTDAIEYQKGRPRRTTNRTGTSPWMRSAGDQP
jgi:hypothetical protein